MLDFGFLNMDCVIGMKEFPDNFFDLAVVDPPYGDGKEHIDGEKIKRRGGAWAKKYGNTILEWDVAPGPEYFKELFRVSKNQIIWGGNYFNLPKTRCFIVWDKINIPEKFTMAMCEYAWTSFNTNAKIYRHIPQGGKNTPRIHPTQKPIELYEWTLKNFAKPGYKILDTHVGSANSLIACERLGLQYVGFEIDKNMYAKAQENLNYERQQINIFDMGVKRIWQ